MAAIRSVTLAVASLAIAACAAVKPEPEVRRVAGPAGAIAVEDLGRGGLPVVFIHSYAGSRAHWSAEMARLEAARRVVAFDMRGHGESAAPADLDYSPGALARDVSAVVDALKIPRFVLVGHSMGGAAAMAYAGANPSRVAGLVLVGAPGRTPPEQARKIAASLEADYDKVMAAYWDQLVKNARPAVRERLAREKESIPRPASMAIVKTLLAYDPLPALERYPGPVLVLYMPEADQPHDLQNLYPRAASRRMTGTSHWPHLDDPAAFAAALDGFLAQVN